MKKLFIFCIIVMLLGVCIYLLLSRPQSDKILTESLSPSQTLQGLSEALHITAELKDYNYANWRTSAGEILPLSGKEIIIGTMNINGVGNYKQINSDNLNSVTIANLAPLLQTTDSYFTTHGFTKSALNSKTAGTPPVTNMFIGYENGETKCVLRVDEQSDPFGNFACGTVDTNQYNLQKPFTKLFFGSSYYDEPVTSFRVSKLEENFARGSASGLYSGYEWMAKKVNSTWSIVWRGQEIPLCSEMTALQIPKSIYDSCYLPDGTLH